MFLSSPVTPAGAPTSSPPMAIHRAASFELGPCRATGPSRVIALRFFPVDDNGYVRPGSREFAGSQDVGEAADAV